MDKFKREIASHNRVYSRNKYVNTSWIEHLPLIIKKINSLEYTDFFQELPKIWKEYLLKLQSKDRKKALLVLEKIFEIALNYRKINAKNRLLKQARFDILKTFDDYDFSEVDFPETIGIEEIQELGFVLRQENLILYGPVGTGKTHLATAIGVNACIAGKKVRFYKVANLVNELIEAYEKSELRRFMSSLKKYDL